MLPSAQEQRHQCVIVAAAAARSLPKVRAKMSVTLRWSVLIKALWSESFSKMSQDCKMTFSKSKTKPAFCHRLGIYQVLPSQDVSSVAIIRNQ